MVSKERMEMLKIYNEGLDFYRNKQFTEAMGKFNQCLEIVPGDAPSKMYIGRCKEYLKTPPPADWDGVFRMKTK